MQLTIKVQKINEMLTKQTVFDVIAGHRVECAKTTMVWLRCPKIPPIKDVPYIVQQGDRGDRHHDGTVHFYGIEKDSRFFYNPDTESSNTFADQKPGEYYVATKKRQCLKATCNQLFTVSVTVHVCINTRTIQIQTDSAVVFVVPCTDIHKEILSTEWNPATLAQMQRDAARLDALMTTRSYRELQEKFATFQLLFAFLVTVKNK